MVAVKTKTRVEACRNDDKAARIPQFCEKMRSLRQGAKGAGLAGLALRLSLTKRDIKPAESRRDVGIGNCAISDISATLAANMYSGIRSDLRGPVAIAKC